MLPVRMDVLGLIWFFGLCSSVEGQLTVDGIRSVVQELVEERLKSHSGEWENRSLWEEVAFLRSAQGRLEAELKDMQTIIKEMSDENENSKQKIDELYEENLELKRMVKDNMDHGAGTDHSNESLAHVRTKSVRFLANSGVPSTSPIAFSARLSQNIDNVHDNEIFFFNNLITNFGNAYNKNNGMFTAPLKGIYAFYSSILASSGKSLEAHIVRNGNEFCNLYAGDMDFWGPGFNMAIIELEVGDAVWVKIHDKYHGAGVTVDGPWTSFSGFLLYETE